MIVIIIFVNQIHVLLMYGSFYLLPIRPFQHDVLKRPELWLIFESCLSITQLIAGRLCVCACVNYRLT